MAPLARRVVSAPSHHIPAAWFAATVLAGGAHAQTINEVEPNNARAKADIIEQAPATGLSIVGTTTGSSGTGSTSPDFFFVYPTPAPAAIYRHRLTLASTTPGHIMNLRGRAQNMGFPATGDVVLQLASGSGSSPRIAQWYGFGRRGGVFVGVFGSSSTTAAYTIAHERTTIFPIDLGSFGQGPISITTIAQGHSTDTELFLFDANLQPIPDAGNDQPISPLVAQAALTRTLPAGTWYLAVSDANTAWQFGAPPDDADRTNFLTEFLDTFVCGSAATNRNLTFSISDAAGNTRQVNATKTEPFEVRWFTLQTIPAACSPADVTAVGGPPLGPDGLLTGDDFVTFINAFAAGCP